MYTKCTCNYLFPKGLDNTCEGNIEDNQHMNKFKAHIPWKRGANANEIDTKKKKKCTWPTRKLYSTDWRWGLALGVTQILGLVSGVM